MKLQNLLQEKCIVVHTTATDKPAVLKEIAHSAKNSPLLKALDESEILRGLEAREELGSTGFGEGIAIPHCRLEGVDDFVVGIITSPNGVDFDSLDGKKTYLFIFVIAPQKESSEHIRVLSAISQTLRIPGAVDEIIAESSATGVRESFLRYSLSEVDMKGHDDKNLFHIIVQNEDTFREILQLFSAVNCPVIVMETDMGDTYLARSPIYADLWTDRKRAFNRTVIAIVNKAMTNETIRRMEQITGPLDKSSQTLLIVQNLFYVAGNLEA